jgi:hypothetical protein
MKYLIISIVSITVLGGLTLLFWPKASPVETNQSPTSSSGTPNYQSTVTARGNAQVDSTPTTTQTTVSAYDGTNIRTNSFMSTSTEIAGEVFLVGTLGGNDRYRISYYLPLRTFVILLLAEPLKETRELAEQDVMQILGISESDACRLLYIVSLPTDVNPLYGGKNLGFSFCPGATPL